MSQDLILADGTMIHLTGVAERDNIILLSRLRTIANDYASLKEDILLNGFQEDYYQRTILGMREIITEMSNKLESIKERNKQ